MQSLIIEVAMKKKQDLTDHEGRKWITPARAANIWNERVKEEFKMEGTYTRWSVSKRESLQRLPTPLGDLYLESEIRTVSLRPHPKRPDVTERNKRRRKQDTLTEK